MVLNLMTVDNVLQYYARRGRVLPPFRFLSGSWVKNPTFVRYQPAAIPFFFR